MRNTSIAAYNSPLITWIITVFMFLAGTNFSLLFLLLRGRLREVLHSEELRIYTIIVVCATVFICLDLSAHSHLSFSQTFTDSAFQVVTIISTTGLCHEGLRPLAHNESGRADGADVHGCVRRVDLRRHQDLAHHAAGQEPAPRDEPAIHRTTSASSSRRAVRR